jgi:hypothetical protein
METKTIYRSAKGEINRVRIAAKGSFKCDVRRGLELCKEMGIDYIELPDDAYLTACAETGVEGNLAEGKSVGTVVTLPVDVKDGYYEGNSLEKLRMQAFGALMQGKVAITYNRLCPGAITKDGTPGPLFYLLKEMNYRITKLGRTLMALTKVAPSKWKILANNELSLGCAVTEFKDSEGNRYLLIQNTDYENKDKKAKAFCLQLQKKYRIYRVNPHTGQQILSKTTDEYNVLVMPGDVDLLRFQDAEEEAYFVKYVLKK